MKVQYSLPKDERFFGDYASLTPTLVKLGYLAQIVSALTEFGVLYALVKGSLQDFFPDYAPLAGLFGAIVGTAFLEVGLRKFIPYSIRAILYKRFVGLHLFISCFVFAITFGLLRASGYLSFQGSKELVKMTAPKPKLESLGKTDSTLSVQKAEAFRRYSADSLEVITRFTPINSALKTKYSAQLQQERQQLARWEGKGKTYRGQITAAKARISAIQAQEAAELASLEQDKAKRLEAALKARNKALAVIEAEYNQQRLKIEKKNNKAEASTESQVKNYGSGLAWFTVVCLLVLLFSVAIDEIHKKGSAIEEVALPNQYYFSESIAAEFWGMVNDKINYHLRAFIRKQAARTPEPPAPEEPPTLWEIAQQGMKRKTPGQEAGNGQQEETGYSSLFEGVFSRNGHPLQNGHSTGNGTHIDNSATTLTEAQERRPIGFNLPLMQSVSNALHYEAPEVLTEVVEVDKSKKPCQHCETLFRPKTTWQKFCTIDCREAFHEAKHGQPFKPGQFHKAKNRKV